MDAPTVVFDTNVLVAELAFPDEPERCVSLVESGAVELAVSPATLREFAAVLGYDHLPPATRASERRAQAVELVTDLARLVEPAVRIDAAPDPDDDAILECALAAAADCVVSDDAHLVDLARFVGSEILTREAFLARHAERAHRNPEG